MYIPTVSMGKPVQVLYKSVLEHLSRVLCNSFVYSYRWEGQHIVLQNAINEWWSDLLHMLFNLNARSFIHFVFVPTAKKMRRDCKFVVREASSSVYTNFILYMSLF